MSTTVNYKFGWHPDIPDPRDLTIKSQVIAKALPKVTKKLPNKTDWRKLCSPVENPGNLGSCTANAGVGIFEFYENTNFGKYVDGSRLFVYKVERIITGKEGDAGYGYLPYAYVNAHLALDFWALVEAEVDVAKKCTKI